MMRFIGVMAIMGFCGLIGDALASEWGAVGGLLLGFLVSQPLIREDR